MNVRAAVAEGGAGWEVDGGDAVGCGDEGWV
jgi:hypothetical protein